ncbi:MAG: AMP-binding protein [Bacteroidales bacterium]
MSWILEKIINNAERPGIIDHDRSYTYADLSAEINRYRDLLKATGIKPGDVVGVLSSFSFKSIALLLALAENECIVTPLDPDNIRDIHDTIEKSSLDFLFRLSDDSETPDVFSQHPQKHPLIEQLRQQGRAGLILFSSGTTGIPKVMLHDLTRLVDSYRNEKVKNTNSMILLGFDHIGGIDSLLRLLSICATITLPGSRKPSDICRQIEKYKVNVLPATPTFLNLMLISEAHRQFDLSSLEIIGFGAESMPKSLLIKLKQAFPRVKMQQKFGTSETNAIRIKNDNLDEQFFRIEDAGVEYKIVEGELWLKSKSNILGYLNSEIPAFEEGWFRTGDLVETKDDFIRIIGRKKEMINVGGEKVLPSDIEEVLLEMPEILDCKVYGIENLLTGQVVAADIVVIPTAEKGEIRNMIRQYCKKKLLPYQVPVKINLVDEIELSARNKKVRS